MMFQLYLNVAQYFSLSFDELRRNLNYSIIKSLEIKQGEF